MKVCIIQVDVRIGGYSKLKHRHHIRSENIELKHPYSAHRDSAIPAIVLIPKQKSQFGPVASSRDSASVPTVDSPADPMSAVAPLALSAPRAPSLED